MPKHKAIFLYDFFEIRGGAERLALVLCKSLGIDLCFGFWADDSYSRTELSDICSIDLNTYSGLIGWRVVKQIRTFQAKTRFLDRYRISIYSGTYAPLAVCNHPRGPNIYYCHTPPRFIYDQRHFYLSMLPYWQRPMIKVLSSYIQPRYETAIEKMDVIVANSENIRKRIRRYLNKESIVIHPPCDTKGFIWQDQRDYYLSTSRLARLKRVDLIVEAFRRMPDKKLIVLSGGTELYRLRSMAAGSDNIIFTGWVSEKQLRELVNNAIATIYVPKDEDFGISPVESMSAGKPVIGVSEGGLLETVINGETGILLNPDPEPEAIVEAVRCMTPASALKMRSMCEKRSQAFGTEVFLEKMRRLLLSYL